MGKNFLKIFIGVLVFGMVIPCFGITAKTVTESLQPPLYFIPNKGQVDAKVLYYSKTPGYTLWATRQGLVFDMASRQTHRDVSGLTFVGGNPAPEIVPLSKTGHRVNYFKGLIPENRHTGIHTYGAILYKDIYKGISIRVYGVENKIEYDWVAAPDADCERIRFKYNSMGGTCLDADGNLVISTRFGDVIHKKPRAYQVINGKTNTVAVAFKKHGKDRYGFKIGRYDKNRELIIDPVVILLYSSYLGRSSDDYGCAAAVTGNDEAVIAGYTYSPDFPTEIPYQGNLNGDVDAFISKLSPAGDSLSFSTYLGGSADDFAYGVAVNESGMIYIVGKTDSSTDFPLANTIQGTYGGGDWDCFTAKLSADGSTLNFSDYLGGNDTDIGYGIAVRSGVIYLTGQTWSDDFPVVNAYQDQPASTSSEAFVTAVGWHLNYYRKFSTYLGGSAFDGAYGIAVDSISNCYVTGASFSSDFPTLDPYQASISGIGSDAFLTSFGPQGALIYSTYLGGGNIDWGTGIAVDNNDCPIIVGTTYSPNFPTFFEYQGDQIGVDAFVAKFRPSNCDLIFSTYLGGSSNDYGTAIGVGDNRDPIVTGYTESIDFPTDTAFQSTSGGQYDAFVTQLNYQGQYIEYSSYLGGEDDDFGKGIAVNSNGSAFVTGHTVSSGFPVLNGFQPQINGGVDAFITKISMVIFH